MGRKKGSKAWNKGKVRGNETIIGTVTQIITSKGDVILVDLMDYCKYRLYRYTWCLANNGYAKTTYKGKELKMHRLLLDTPKGMETDHINGNKLDNRRENLRVCSKSENKMNVGRYSHNTSGVIGITRYKNANKWVAYVFVDNKRKYLGCYDTFEEAVRVRKDAELKYYKDFRYDHGQQLNQQKTLFDINSVTLQV